MSASAGSVQAKQRIEDEAMTWLLELTGTEPTLQRWVAFSEWLSSNPDHEAIYCRFEKELQRLLCKAELRRCNPGIKNRH